MAKRTQQAHKPLAGQVALVAGATRGAGRGIARALGEAGATVYCTGRSVKGSPSPYKRPETIDETAEMIVASGGTAIPLRVDHSIESEVEALFAQIDREQGRTRFTRFHLRVRLLVPEGTNPEMAERALHCAEDVCLVSNSLSGGRTLETVVEVAPDSACADAASG